MKTKLFSNNSVFVKEVEAIASSCNIDYLEAIVIWCEKNSVEVEVVAGWIKKEPAIKARLQAEAENLNFLKKGARLPI
jgi:Phage late-transcription coactivator